MALFQNESKCETFDTKISSACSFIFHANQSHFHKNGFALRLALKQRHKGTRKWPIHCTLKWRHLIVRQWLIDSDIHQYDL